MQSLDQLSSKFPFRFYNTIIAQKDREDERGEGKKGGERRKGGGCKGEERRGGGRGKEWRGAKGREKGNE